MEDCEPPAQASSSSSSDSSSSSSVDALLQSLPCEYLWVHGGSGGRLRRAVEKTIQGLKELLRLLLQLLQLVFLLLLLLCALQHGCFCLAAKVAAANRCISVAEVSRRHLEAKGTQIFKRSFFAGLGAQGEARRGALCLFVLMGVAGEAKAVAPTAAAGAGAAEAAGSSCC
ncbi:hypothetical protein Esti_006694 [Eimeria stiedai]